MVPITGMYAGILALFLVALSVRTLRTRRRNQIAVGDGGNSEMLRAMRVHGNFAEYAPLAAKWWHRLGLTAPRREQRSELLSCRTPAV